MSGGEVPPFQDWSNFGAGDTWRPPPPGFPTGLWIDLTPAAPPQPAPPVAAQPAPPTAPPSTPPSPAPVVTPPAPGSPPEEIGDVDFGYTPDVPYPLERLPGPALPAGGLDNIDFTGPVWRRVADRYEYPPDGWELYRRLEAIRYGQEGYDREEFGADYRLDKRQLDELWPLRERRTPGDIPPVWVPQQVGTPPQGILQAQPTEPTRPRVEIPLPGEGPINAPGPTSGEERARRRQGARERDAIIRQAAERARIDTRVRRGRGVIEGVLRRAMPRIIGRVLGPVGEIFSPEELGRGEPSVEDMARREAEALERQIDDIERRAREVFDPYRGRQLGPEIAPLPSPAPPVISAPWPTPSPTPSPSQAPPQPSTAPQPRPTSTPRSMPAPSPVPAIPGWVGPVIAGVVLSLRGSGSPVSRFTIPAAAPFDPLTPPFPGPGTDPLTPPSGNPLTRFDAAQLGSAPPATRTRTRQRECECKPKKRKKRRECTVRGNLAWTSGPKKGKPAGSRCVNFKGKP